MLSAKAKFGNVNAPLAPPGQREGAATEGHPSSLKIAIPLGSHVLERHPMCFPAATDRNTPAKSALAKHPPPVPNATMRISRIDLAQFCASLPSPQRINAQN
jgi:hypothetical protein